MQNPILCMNKYLLHDYSKSLNTSIVPYIIPGIVDTVTYETMKVLDLLEFNTSGGKQTKNKYTV